MTRFLGCAALVAAVVGCGNDESPGAQPDPTRGCAAEAPRDPPVVQPTGCYATATLNGTIQPLVPITFGPVTLGEIAVCLRLEATTNRVAGRFVAHTDDKDGPVSGFDLVLTELNGSVVREGKDLVAGKTTRAELTYDVPAGQVQDVLLRVTADDPCTTRIHVAMAEATLQ